MEIIALNPSKPRAKKRASKKGSKSMARRRNARGQFVKGGGGRKRAKSRKRRYRRNPGEEAIMLANPSRGGRVRRYAKRAYHGARGFLGGLGLGEAARFMGGAMIGIGAAFLVRKKFGKVGDQREKWEMRDYIMAILGSLGASILAKHAFKVRPETSGAILKGGLALVAIKILQDQIVPQSDTLRNWIGEGGEGSWSGEELYGPGDLYLGEGGENYVMGEDGQWRGIDEGDRVGFGALVAPGSLGEEMYGEDMYGAAGLVAPGSLGEDMYGAVDPYAAAYGRRGY
jgi:hypothetical protein